MFRILQFLYMKLSWDNRPDVFVLSWFNFVFKRQHKELKQYLTLHCLNCSSLCKYFYTHLSWFKQKFSSVYKFHIFSHFFPNLFIINNCSHFLSLFIFPNPLIFHPSPFLCLCVELTVSRITYLYLTLHQTLIGLLTLSSHPD